MTRAGRSRRLATCSPAEPARWSSPPAFPVHTTYFTAVVDRDGNLRTFGDLYGLDTRMGAALFDKKVPFVTPRYDAEMLALRARQRPAASGAPGLSSLADAISNVFSP